ncbi:MAG: signal peptidase I [Neisseriaceae bacterium]
MESLSQGLSKWFYLGVAAFIVGIILVFLAKGRNKSKTMENGYFILILGLVGIISEWTDFATVLFIFVIISGAILLFNKVFLARKRPNDAPIPHYIHYSREFFPIVLAVWILRGFLFEAYLIPSSSMRPDLTVGDFILVNKFTYGIREPFTNRVIIPVSQINRGDVVVFKDQQVRNRDLIKRVVGIGGDKIVYKDKRLTINGVPLKYTPNGTYQYSDTFPVVGTVNFLDQKFTEDLFGVKHQILTWDQVPSLNTQSVYNFPNKKNCNYIDDNQFECVVPTGEYFMMGDNRDNSEDSRYWGFVPNESVLGKAMYVIINFHDMKRLWKKI